MPSHSAGGTLPPGYINRLPPLDHGVGEHPVAIGPNLSQAIALGQAPVLGRQHCSPPCKASSTLTRRLQTLLTLAVRGGALPRPSNFTRLEMPLMATFLLVLESQAIPPQGQVRPPPRISVS